MGKDNIMCAEMLKFGDALLFVILNAPTVTISDVRCSMLYENCVDGDRLTFKMCSMFPLT